MAGQFYAKDFFKQGFWADGFWANTATSTTPSGGYYEPKTRVRRSREELKAERRLAGILLQPSAKNAIRDVALAAIESESKPGLALSHTEQSNALKWALERKGLIVADGLNDLLVKAISQEIRRLLEVRRMEDEAIVLLLLND